MTTAFVLQVKQPTNTAYVGKGGTLSQIPYFWRSAKHVVRVLDKSGWRCEWKPGMEPLTQVLRITDLELGMRDCTVNVMTMQELREFSPKTIDPKGYVFKLQQKVNGKPYFVAGNKTWTAGGHLRQHITYTSSRLHRYLTSPDYEVVEIKYEDDLITPHTIKRTSVRDFLKRSPAGAKTLALFDRGSRSIQAAPAWANVAEKQL